MAAVYWGKSTKFLKNNGEFTDNASEDTRGQTRFFSDQVHPVMRRQGV
jgi:hypothetical protein